MHNVAASYGPILSAIRFDSDHVLSGTTVAPNVAVVAYTVLLFVVVCCGIITALKGRWGWFLLGLLTFGLLWLVGALRPALPGSAWLRLATSVRTRSRGTGS